MKILDESFFEKDTISIARELLGKFVVRQTDGEEIVGKIVETEAYLKDDPASHSFRGETKRNSQMFCKAGTSYIYFTYGMYFCFNVVTNCEGVGEAVLIRAIEPITGIELMKKNRNVEDIKNLCNGPAKLTLALGLNKSHNGINLIDKNSSLVLMEGEKEDFEIIQTTRIGISNGKELLNRFYIKGNPFVSKLLS